MAKKSKKEKAADLEQHRQLKRAKKLQKKLKKNVALPQKHRKNKRWIFHVHAISFYSCCQNVSNSSLQ